MNGSRSTPSRHGDRSSLDALNRTIEGLEARIEGLMAGAARDSRQAKNPEHREPPRNSRSVEPQAAVNSYRTEFVSDPLAEIRERQRMLGTGHDRGAPPEHARRQDMRREEPRRNAIRPPEAHRPQERQIPRIDAMRQPEARYGHDEVRSAVLQPRPQAGSPLQTDGNARDIAQALVGLRQELKKDISEGVAREISALRTEIRSIRSIAEDQRFADDLRGDLARLAESINQLGHHAAPEAAGLRAEFEELRAAMDGLAHEDSLRRMESRWEGLEERIGDLDSAALREELISLAYRIDEIKGQLGEMSDSPVIRALEQKLITVASAMEQLGSRMQPNDAVIAEQFAGLDQRLDEISRAIAAGSRASAAASIDQSFLQRVEGRINVLAEQIDAIGQAAHRQTDPTEALSARIEALAGRIEELADEQTAVRLEERLEQLAFLLEQNQRPVPQTDLSDHLADISRKIEGLERGTVNDVLAERLDHLARRIDELDFQPRQQQAIDQHAFGRIEDRLSDIAARLDEATAAPRGDESALRSLEDQITHLSALMGQPQSGPAGLSPEFEHRMATIEGYMATNDEYIIEAARQAAEAVVEAYSRNTAPGSPASSSDMAALAALADDLRNLEDLTRNSESRTHQTFEALHGTLVQIADRLDGMEERLAASAYPAEEERGQELRTPAMPAAAQLTVDFHDDLMHRPAEETVAPATFGTRTTSAEEKSQGEVMLHADATEAKTVAPEKAAKPSLLTELSRRFLPGHKGDTPKNIRAVIDPTPSIDPADVLPADHENDLLEPGTGAPDVRKILERVRASQAAGEFDGDRAGAPARADYIAAARRAAKAAAQETDPAKTISTAKDMRKAARPSTDGLGGALSRHRRPILMAVGAVLLVLMAMPLAKTLTSGAKAPEAPAARIEAPAKPAPQAGMPGSNEAQPVEEQVAGDSIETAPEASAPAEAPAAEPPRQVGTAGHLTDPQPTSGDIAGMVPADAQAEPQEGFVPAEKAEAPAPIAVPPGIEPKSLADAAAAGDANALFEIGARFTEGRGVKTDLSEAANWYKLAADRGLAPAQYRLANLFEKGTGVDRDLDKAIAYYRQAAEAGNASAMHNLAVLYASGAAGQADYAEAVEWFGKAAGYGVADSQFNLAILYARGNGVKQDLEESYKWFAIAAKGGDQDAAQKRDEVANAMRKEQLESARAKVDLWKAKPLDASANSINAPEEWASGKPLTTASVDMEKAIRNIQAILNKNGFDAGTPDGKMGAKTIAAIKGFQSSVGQEPTGKINDALVKELLARNS